MRMRGVLAPVVALAGALLLSGCGPDCQSTCNKLFQETECNLQRPGQSRDDLLRSCNDACADGLETPGEIRHAGYPQGHDTDAVLHSLGKSDDEIQRLREAGVV